MDKALNEFTGIVRRAVDDYDMISEGDKIAVGVSGGKDSMILLLALNHLKKYYPKPFELEAITIELGFEGMDFTPVKELCASLGIPYTCLKTDIKEIVSHEQAINQCSEFLKKLEGVKITCVANTALASKMVAESDRSDLAALSSHNCAELYGLNCIEANVQDKGNNYTRFICISKKPEIYPGADRTSIMAVLPHKPGSLYRVLSRFYTLGIDLIKLESRPIPDRDFEFMFYFDFQTSVYSDEFVQLICELEDVCEEFKYLGSYSEVVR